MELAAWYLMGTLQFWFSQDYNDSNENLTHLENLFICSKKSTTYSLENLGKNCQFCMRDFDFNRFFPV